VEGKQFMGAELQGPIKVKTTCEVNGGKDHLGSTLRGGN